METTSTRYSSSSSSRFARAAVVVVGCLMLAGMFATRARFGPELIPNSDFSAGSANWTTSGGGGVFADGQVSFDGPTNGASNLFSSAASVAGKTYLLTIEISASGGSVFYYNDDGAWVQLPDVSVGTHRVEVHFASAVLFGLRASSLFVGAVTRFSAREKIVA